MSFKRLLGAVFIAINLAAATPGVANLIQNGGFENPTVSGPYQYLTSLANWTLTGNPTVVFNSAYRPVGDGLQSLQIERVGNAISQSFASTIGQLYQVDFLLSGFNNAPNAHLGLSVATNGVPLLGQFTGTGLLYIPYSLFFTASALTTTLTFSNTGPTILGSEALSSYPHLDNISVTAVPEPSTYVMLLAGLGFVVFVAMRRQR